MLFPGELTDISKFGNVPQDVPHEPSPTSSPPQIAPLPHQDTPSSAPPTGITNAVLWIPSYACSQSATPILQAPLFLQFLFSRNPTREPWQITSRSRSPAHLPQTTDFPQIHCCPVPAYRKMPRFPSSGTTAPAPTLPSCESIHRPPAQVAFPLEMPSRTNSS